MNDEDKLLMPNSRLEDDVLPLVKHPEYHLHEEMPLGVANYILNLAPGEVRYMPVGGFVKYEVDEWIAYFKRQSLTPEIQGPFGGESDGIESVNPIEFVQEPTWEDNFRILHNFAVLHYGYSVPYSVYKCFHKMLNLHSFEFHECINSWVKKAWGDYFVAQTYVKSSQHLVVKFGDELTDPAATRFAVFEKTPFVLQRVEQIQRLQEAEKTSENLEQLRRSNFKIFVYLIEDLRNGLVKIGQSQTPEKRENTLQSEVPEISLRFYIPAHDTAEKELHEMFDAKRIRGEWFQLAPQDILAVIGFLKQKGDLTRAFADYEWLGKITLGSQL